MNYNSEKALSLAWNGQVAVLTRNTNSGNNILYSYDGTTWNPGNIISNQFYPYNVKWLGRSFNIVGNISAPQNSVIKSTDGIHFYNISNSSLPAPAYDLDINLEMQHSVTFPRNMILCLNISGQISYSTNSGTSWTSISVFDTSANNAAWNGKYWVAVGSGSNTICTSPDGIHWTGRGANPDTININGRGVCWSKKQAIWTVVGNGTSSTGYSYDGVYWLGGTNIFTQGLNVSCNDNIWVACGTSLNSNSTVAYSYDGKTWKYGNLQTSLTCQNIQWNGYQWVNISTDLSNNVYVGTSLDGIYWMTNSIPVSNSTTGYYNIYANPITPTSIITIDKIAYIYNNNNYGNYVQNVSMTTAITAVSYNGEYFLYGQTNKNVLLTLDGINISSTKTLTNNTINFAWNNPDQGAVTINPMTIAMGDGSYNTIGYSYDGIYWYGVGNNIFSVRGNKAVWNGILWCAVGTGKNWIATSYDGIIWTGSSDQTMSEGIDIAWNGTVFVAVGIYNNSGQIATSPDGFVWTAISNSSTIFSIQCSAIAWCGKAWIAYGSGGNTSAVSQSVNANTWSPTNVPNLVMQNADSIFANSGYMTSDNTPAPCIASCSSDFTSNNTYKAFTGRGIFDYNNGFVNTPTKADSVYKFGLYPGSSSTTVGTMTIKGPWIQLQKNDVSSPIIYYYIAQTSKVAQSFGSMYLLGSNDGNVWNVMDYYVENRRNINRIFIAGYIDGVVLYTNYLYTNTNTYTYFRFVFPTTDINFAKSAVFIGGIDLYTSNQLTTTISRYIKPIITNTQILHPNSIYNFNTYKNQIYYTFGNTNNYYFPKYLNGSSNQTFTIPTDLLGNFTGTSTKTAGIGNFYQSTVIGCSSSLYGSTGSTITSTCYDGTNYIITCASGTICYMTNTNFNTYLTTDISYNGGNIISNIGGTIYSSCYNGKYVLFSGERASGNVITYGTFGSSGYTWNVSANANNLFGNVYGVSSNSGYGWTVPPNRIYANSKETFAVVSPTAYNQSINNVSITMNLNTIPVLQNESFPNIS